MPKGSGRVQYALVAVDYFTKWAKAEVLTSITPVKIKEFVYKNIIFLYGVSHTIVSDNDKQFICNKFKEFCDSLQIKKVFSLVAQPQANGQVEIINKTIKHNLKTKLKDLKGRWADELSKVLWAFRTSVRTPTGETPFSLIYGYEAMIPVDTVEGSLRRENYDSDQNFVLQR